MAKFEMKLDMSSIKKKIKTTEEQIKKGVEQGLQVCASEIKQMEQRQIENTTGNGQYVPTGQLKRSVTIMPIEWSPYSASITIEPKASYAPYVELGTGIYASNGNGRKTPWLIFLGTDENGDDIFRYTRGIPPHFFVQDTYEYYVDKAPAIIAEQIYKCMR